MLCKSCGDEIKGESVLGLCEKCWREELNKGQHSNSDNNVEHKNKFSKSLETFSSILIAILTIVGILISASTNSIFPVLIVITLGLIQVFFFLALAEIIQKLQNIEDNTRSYKYERK